MKTSTRIKLTFLVLVLSVFMMGGLYLYSSFESIKEDNTPTIGQEDESKNKEENNGKEENNKDENNDLKEIDGITNILLIGVDDRGNGDARSDTMMILTLDGKHKKMKITSLMRDAYVDIPGYGSTKLNHSYAYGGINLLMKTIESNFNIKLDKYVKINFQGFKDLINSIDGITVNISGREELNELNRCLLLEKYEDKKNKDRKFNRIIDKSNLLQPRDEGAKYLIKNNPYITKEEYEYVGYEANFVYSTGNVKLNGVQALAYSRMRHSTNGSYGRTERQRNVVNLIINKLKDTPYIKYPVVANSLIPYVRTNADIGEALNLAYTAYKINNFNLEQMQIPPSKLCDGLILSREFLYENIPIYVFTMDKENTVKVMHDFIFEDKKYNESDYSQFKASYSGYYSPVIHKSTESNDEGEEKTENNSNDESSQENDVSNGNNEEEQSNSSNEQNNEQDTTEESNNEEEQQNQETDSDTNSEEKDNNEENNTNENGDNEVDNGEEVKNEEENSSEESNSEESNNEEEEQNQEVDKSESESSNENVEENNSQDSNESNGDDNDQNNNEESNNEENNDKEDEEIVEVVGG